MINKRIYKIAQLSFLIAVRQIWGLLRNLYHLSYEPYLTLKELREKRDKSQFALLSAFAVLPAMVYVGLRVVWDYYKYGQILRDVGDVFAAIAVIEVVILSYLGYWTWQVLRKDGYKS